MNSNSRILVTGSTGFLGFRIAYKLLEKGETHLRCFARPGSNIDKLERLMETFPNAQIEIFQGNLINPGDVRYAVSDIDIIYHCAAGMNGPIASMYFNTVVGTKNLLEAVVRGNWLKRFVHISSFAVYGTADLPRGTVLNEKTPVEENLKKRDDAYTYTKLKQERLVWKYREIYDLPVVVLRPGVVYGPRGDEISRRVGLELFGYFLNIGKNNILPLSYVDNCADAIILAGTVPHIEGEVFNIHDSDLRTSNEFLSLYVKKTNRIKAIKVPYSFFWVFSWFINKYSRYSNGQIPPVLSPYKTASTWKGNRFDNSKLKKVLGWIQRVSTKEGLERHFDHCKRIHSKNEQLNRS
jgi:nucleoside-diphosphate-sugar epimerase